MIIYVCSGRAIGNAQWLFLLQKQQCLVFQRTGFKSVSFVYIYILYNTIYIYYNTIYIYIITLYIYIL